MTQLTPQQEDPVVHGLLANLPEYSPSPGFADRVMRRVYRPAPGWVQWVTRVCSTALTPRRVWTAVGGFAATSAVAMVAIVVAAFSYWVHIETVWQGMVSLMFDAWRLTVQLAAGFAVATMRWFEPLGLGQPSLFTLVTTTLVVLAVSAFGLRRTIHLYRTERISLHARR